MKLRQIYEAADALAPFSLSEEYKARYGAYDNSGILVDCGGEIEGVLFSLDLSARAAEEAERVGANCIVTHHPAIYAPVKSLSENDVLFRCIRAGVSVVSAHLNLDAAPGGIDERLMQGLGGRAPLAVMEGLTGGGYGRVYDVEERSFSAFCGDARRTFCTERAVAYGERPVARVASFCGAGFSDEAVAFAAARGADTLVSSDGKHHLIARCAELGLNVLLLTHYAAENYGFRFFAEAMREKLRGVTCSVFTDQRLL